MNSSITFLPEEVGSCVISDIGISWSILEVVFMDFNFCDLFKDYMCLYNQKFLLLWIVSIIVVTIDIINSHFFHSSTLYCYSNDGGRGNWTLTIFKINGFSSYSNFHCKKYILLVRWTLPLSSPSDFFGKVNMYIL